MTDKNNGSLQKQIDELEALVEWFEQDDIDLEQAIEKFDEGAKLAGQIKERLSVLENKITVLKKRFDEDEE